MDEVIVERLLRGIWQWHAWHGLSVVQVHFDLWSRNYLLSHYSLKGTWTGCYLDKSKVFLHPAKSISSVCSKYFSQRDRLGPVAIWTRGGKVNFHPFNRVPSIHPNGAWLGHKETAAQNIIHFNPLFMVAHPFIWIQLKIVKKQLPFNIFNWIELYWQFRIVSASSGLNATNRTSKEGWPMGGRNPRE